MHKAHTFIIAGTPEIQNFIQAMRLAHLCLLYWKCPTFPTKKKIPKEQSLHIREYTVNQSSLKKVKLITLVHKQEKQKLCVSVSWPTSDTECHALCHWRSHGPDSCLFCSPGSVCSALHLSQPNYRVSKYLGVFFVHLTALSFSFFPWQDKKNKKKQNKIWL